MKLALPSPMAVGVLAAIAASVSFSAIAQQAAPAQSPPAASQSAGNAVASPEATNTRMNRRDRNSSSTTPTDQSNDSTAVHLVAKVRKAITGDDTLSVKARNIKVVANQGVVTLRGPVASAKEKARVQQDVANVPGVTRVDNQLDIAMDDSH